MDRIARLRREMKRRDLDNFLVTRLSNIRYLCGFSGSAGTLLITPRKARFFSDFRYKEQAAQQVRNADVIIYPDELLKELRRRPLNLQGRLGFEAAFLDVAAYNSLREVLPGPEWVPTTKVVEQIASVKEPEEIEKIRKAAAITDEVFAEILKLIKPGVRELDISAEISYLHKKKGADGDSFTPIVASGPRSALPHGLASDKKIKSGELVTVDLGCFYQGYASDLTRTVAVGSANGKMKTIYYLVLKAQTEAIAAARAGLKARELDEVARKIIRDGGHGEHFGHGLGHGLGLEVHAEPRVSFLFEDVLKPGQVVTIEPGIYIPDMGGVRIEDDVLITDGSAEVITQSPRDLIVL
ncbi:MAG: aminopeptidase P family protein [Candidatus Zixiibacteriota bacterium]|nr:MAG: aminopeptidase P family protein [candidate division Zixibacteria bacterium]